MRYKVVRHPLVRDDLSTMTIFIGEYAGYDVAETKINDIEATLLSLHDFPHVGTVRNEIYPGLRIIPAAGKAVVCFTVADDRREAYVICVSYGGADWESRVTERG
ncbi:type II toxin-antitoxin system RelE/ParE family toxin [Pararhizobium sp. PWRC1-1]|uniref:type II toxin-antitoxin system RelE/ParE family toxin n=1 Tax=Pararhizobium sp. PWRC1-1 TaxID=2804566 RepID=UPI003CED858E